jgi:hypothetical protein
MDCRRGKLYFMYDTLAFESFFKIVLFQNWYRTILYSYLIVQSTTVLVDDAGIEC